MGVSDFKFLRSKRKNGESKRKNGDDGGDGGGHSCSAEQVNTLYISTSILLFFVTLFFLNSSFNDY